MLVLLLWLRRLALIRSILHLARLLLALGVLILLQLVGNWIASVARIPVPGSVIGMMLLAAGLGSGILPATIVQRAAEPLLRHLSLLYVPAGVALMLYGDLLRREWLPITGGAIASLLAVIVIVGIVARYGPSDSDDRLERSTALEEAV